jgi:hypothetical protein
MRQAERDRVWNALNDDERAMVTAAVELENQATLAAGPVKRGPGPAIAAVGCLGCGGLLALALFVPNFTEAMRRVETKKQQRATAPTTTPAPNHLAEARDMLARAEQQGKAEEQSQQARRPPFKVDVIQFEERDGYFFVRGILHNNSGDAVQFVKLEALYKDASGNTVDVDTTYAVSSDSLANGGERAFDFQTRASAGVTSVVVRVQQ